MENHLARISKVGVRIGEVCDGYGFDHIHLLRDAGRDGGKGGYEGLQYRIHRPVPEFQADMAGRGGRGSYVADEDDGLGPVRGKQMAKGNGRGVVAAGDPGDGQSGRLRDTADAGLS